MKRAREDNVVGPQVKRPATSRGETSGPTQPPAGSQRLTTDDALAYLQAVKDIFKDKKEKYDEFLEVMKDFKAQRIDTAGVIGRVKELFKGHRDLILGFNTFLPKGYEITLPLEEEPPPKKQMVKQPVEFDQAINYVNKIKTRFQYDEQVYKAFLEILNMYRKGNKSINEVYQEVASLFCDHQDLLEEFTYFLPDSTGPAQIVHSSAPKASANSVPRREEKAPGLVVSRHTHLEKIVKKEKAVSIQPDHDRDRNSERAGEREQDRVVVKVEKEHKKKIEKEKEKKDERERKDKEERDSEQEREKELDAMQWLPHKRKSARRADELIRKQSQAGEGGETFAGPSAPTSSVEEKKFSKGLQKELIFFEKIKGRLRNRETYQEFLKCLNLYSAEIINRLELQSLVDDILGKYPELVEGFNDFLTHCENNEGYLANVVSKKFQLGDGPIVKPVKLEKEREKERDREKDKERDREKDRDRERDREKEREREKFTSHLPKDVPSHKVSMLSNKDKYMNKPISELDLSNCERCTPSYRLLPKNYPKPTASHRTDLAHAVINDNWVSVTSGSEDYSFKHMRKNQYEESLFRCEDDRFELDMLLESTAITAKRVEELLEKVHDANAPQELQIRVDDHLSAISLRCVERIYGDHGLDVIDLLRKNAALALPVILNRLRQKQEEWSKCRADMNKVWAEVYAKNYHKSLDHRSFYFKQQDKKSLSTKALLTEVKEINEKKRREDDVILSIAAGNRRPLISDLMFEYCDPTINEDLYKIIKYSSDEMCSTMEQSDKIMRIWTTFIEPIFGVPSRPHGAEDTEEVAKVKAPHAEGRGSSPGESDGSAGIEGQNVGFNQLGSSVELKHGVNSTDEVTAASSKVELETERAAAGIKAVANGQMVATILNDETKLEDGEQVDHKTDSILAGNLQLEKGPVSCAITSNSDLNGNGNVKRAIDTEGAATRPTPETLAGASTSRPSDGRLEANSKERIVLGVEDVGRRRDNKTSESKLDRSPLKCGRVEVVQSGPLGRFEREEGELSPSPEVEERQNANYGSGENVITVTDNLVIGKIPKDTIPNKDSGNRQEDDDDVECDGDAEGEQDVDADDEGEESAPKTSEDSENVSEAGEEVSGSDSGDADDCSHEDNEEDDDDDEEEREGKAESEGEAEGMADAQDGEGEGTSLASSDRSLLSCKPLAAHGASIVSNSVPDKDSTVFYGNDTFYVLFRLHQTLYERVLSAKTNAMAAEQKWKTIKDTTPPDLYAKFMRVLYNLLDGSADNAKFEDDCRAIIGTQSYVLFTLDKLIFKLVKQLQAIASDEMANKLLALHSYEKSRAPGGFIDSVYHANTCVLLHDENIYRFEHRLNPNRLSIQLMDGGLEKHDIAANAIESSFSNYLSDFLLTVPDISERHPIFLTRNKQKYVDEDDYKAMVKVMRNVRVRNGLEYKISCNTCKVSYVLDTEDFLHRRKRKWWQSWPETGSSDQCEVAFVSSKRLLRFHRWVDEHADSKLESCQSLKSSTK